ncbi:peptidylprolyl isomerase [Polaromonas sp. YR568]|uniref:peptidylprolyl isomerase n=1 Tax=Polaromonas sp. YR568 TaxID=1855301 RepID=UPI00398BEDF9
MKSTAKTFTPFAPLTRLMPVAHAALGVLLASLVGAAAAQGAADPVVARLGAVTIGQTEVERLLQGMPDTERAAVKGNRAGVESWLRQRVASEALLREAQSKNWAARPEVKSRIDASVREITARIVSGTYLESIAQLPAGYPSDAELVAAYEQAKPGLNIPATYRVSQIFLATPAGADAAAVAKVRDEAKRVAAQARQGDFAALAKARSQDPRSAERGGDVGALPLEQMLPEMREPVSKLKAGQVSEPVQSESGFHVIKLVESQAARTATLEEVKPRLRLALREQRQQDMVRDYLAKLAPETSVSIDNAALDAALQKVN